MYGRYRGWGMENPLSHPRISMPVKSIWAADDLVRSLSTQTLRRFAQGLVRGDEIIVPSVVVIVVVVTEWDERWGG